ncbi:MAG: hypothetical protein KAS66_09025 [Candidatus Omnitrophica bacterium]|nr:hypothetical protein [Candidatus Omnitrophota bacterium]
MVRLEPLTAEGTCEKCAMKQFAPSITYRPLNLDYKSIELVHIDQCPWFLMMEERDRANSKNRSLQETASDAIDEIDILKKILEKSIEDYSI